MSAARAERLFGHSNLEQLVRLERRAWEKRNLLAPLALRDFQKLTDETFLDLRRKYFCPADLVAEILQRGRLQGKPGRKLPSPRKTKEVGEVRTGPAK